MLADIPAVAYTASWSDFFVAVFAANFKIDFFTSSCPRNFPETLGFSSLDFLCGKILAHLERTFDWPHRGIGIDRSFHTL